MVRTDWTSPKGDKSGSGASEQLIAAPIACLGVRNALRGAFSCETDTPDDFEKLLARLR